MRARTGIGALLVAPALLLAAAEARAAAVCNNAPGANDWIDCTENSAGDIDIDLTNPAISTTGSANEGIAADHSGTGAVDIDVTGGSIRAADAHGVRARYRGAGAGAIRIRLTRVAVSTGGSGDYGVSAQHNGASGTGIDIDVTGGSVATAGGAYGISGNISAASGASISIDVTDVAVSTMGTSAYGVIGFIQNVASTAGTSVAITVTRGSVSTAGRSVHAVYGHISHTSSMAALSGRVAGAAVSTKGAYAHGVYLRQNGEGGIDLDLTDDASVSTENQQAYGVFGWLQNAAGTAPLDIDVSGGSVTTTGVNSFGILGYINRAGSTAALSIDTKGAAISTTGATSHGVYALHLGSGVIDVDVKDVTVSTAGANSHGVVGFMRSAASEAALSIDAAGDNAISVGERGVVGILGVHGGLGPASMTTGAETEIAAPFAVGMDARLTNDANAAGRLAVTHRGAVEAREVGVLARAVRSSGHTFGEGAQTADDASRTAPMIHVVSSGRVTVGDPVRDAFIERKIAGADETLSTAERAVLDAVVAEDSDALDTALDALPAAYDDDYKAEARSLLDKRSATPTAAADLAALAAGESLGLSRAGVRAVALAYTGIAEHIADGDRDPALLAIAEASRTPEQTAALEEQAMLSAAERAVLQAVLTGGDSAAALAALPEAYTDEWKDEIRQFAATYNAGDIRVDITGGTVVAEGNGVEALYAVPHDRNGAVAVSVAGGASVSGGANGLYVRGAGAGEGNFRAQSVTVNGRVTGGGGDSAGVYMQGGGRLAIGENGEVAASSGVAVLADGPGDFHATIAGTADGDVRSLGAGAHTVVVSGTVDGDVHSAGDLSATVSGTVDGDVEGLGGGDHTVTVADSGTVGGGVRAGGDLTVDVSGEAGGGVRSAGALSATVSGTVGGDLEGMGAGAHTVTVSGTLEGGVRAEGDLTAVVSGAVGDGVRSAGGLNATVSGTVEGDLEGLGAGAHTVAISGVLKGGVRAGGALAATVSGDVEGGLRSPGVLKATVSGAGTVKGDLEGLGAGDHAVTVLGTLGGNVRAGGDLTAMLSGAVGGGVRSAGILNASVSGTVKGDIEGVGAGAHTITVSGTVGGGVRAGGDLTTVISGAVGGGVRSAGILDATVSGAVKGDLEGLGSGAHAVTVSGTLDGDLRVGGDLEAEISGVVGGGVRSAGDLMATVSGTVGGDVEGLGAGEHEVTVLPGGEVGGTVRLAASTVTVDGRIRAARLGDRGGTVTVGGTGAVGEVEGVSIGAEDGTLTVDVTLNGRAMPNVIAGDIVNERGEIILFVDGLRMYGPEGPTGAEVPVGVRDVRVRAAAPGRVALVEDYAPRAGVYEALPGLLFRMESDGARGAGAAGATMSADSPWWARLSGTAGSRGAEGTASGAELDFESFGIEAGLTLQAPGMESLSGTVSVLRRGGGADVSLASGGGSIDLIGAGFGLGVSWNDESGWYAGGGFSFMDYDADLASGKRGALRNGVDAGARTLTAGAGRRLALDEASSITPRASLARTAISAEGFTDALGASVGRIEAKRVTAGVGLLAETQRLALGDGALSLRGSVDVESVLSGAETTVEAAGERLRAETEKTRVVLGVGARWREGNLSIGGAFGASAPGSDDAAFGGRLSLGLRF